MSLGRLDFVVLAAYFVVAVGVGLWAGRRERSTDDYFLGGRKQHWLLAGISIVATEVSALTFIAVPAESFSDDWTYLQMYAGSFVGRLIVVYLLLPVFYGSQVTSVYEYLGLRFGPCTRTTASVLFFTAKTIGGGIRLLVGSLAVAVVFGWPPAWVLVGAALLTIGYTAMGGIKSIMWADVFQAIVFIGGPLIAVIVLLNSVGGHWADNLGRAFDAGKFHVCTMDWNPNHEKNFWVLFISAVFMNVAAMGVDQDLTQRMLTCADVKKGQRSLLFNAVVGFPIVCLFLTVGVVLWLRYHDTPLPLDIVGQKTRIFPYFMRVDAPPGLKGLLVAGIFAAAMSTLASSLGSLSSSAVRDIYQPFIKRRADDRHYLAAARWFSAGFGVLLVLIAFAFSRQDQLLWKALFWVGLIFGGLLGVFLLGILTRSRGHDVVNIAAMLLPVGLLALLAIWQTRTHKTLIAGPWWIVVGTICTFVMGAAATSRKRIGKSAFIVPRTFSDTNT